MNNEQIRALMGEIAPVLKEYVSAEVEKATVESAQTIAALQASNQELVKLLNETKSDLIAKLQATQTSVMELQSIPVAKDGLDGKDGPSVDDVRAMIVEEVAKLPPPAAGKDGKDGINGAPGEKGEPGTSVYISDVAKHIEEHFYAPFQEKMQAAINLAINGNKEMTDAFLKSANEIFQERLVVWERDIGEHLLNVKDGINGAKGDQGEPGKDVDMEAVTELVTKRANEILLALSTKVDVKIAESTKAVNDALANVRNGVDGRDGKDGKDVDLNAVDDVIKSHTQSIVAEVASAEFVKWEEMAKETVAEIQAAVKDGVDGKDGKDVDLEALFKNIDDKITAATAEIIGKSIANWDDTINKAIARLKDGKDGEPGPAGRDGIDGKDADMVELSQLVHEQVIVPAEQRIKELETELVSKYIEPAIKAIPVPENGKDGRDGVDGKDGVNLAGMLIDREGQLIATLSNGEVKNLGPIIGSDGLGFEDLRVEQTSARKFSLVFTRDGREKAFEFNMPIVLDCGVYKAGANFFAGDGVTYSGSYWIAKSDGALGIPGACDDWRLAVKKGRDAREPVKTTEPRKDPVKIGDQKNG